MLTFTEYSVEFVKDPFGILAGKRYEFMVDLQVPEDDELFSENGVYARVIFMANEDESSIVKYDLIEKSTDRILDLNLEPEEEETLAAFCREHMLEA